MDSKLDFENGLSILLDNHLQHLRSIKDTEEKWMERTFAIFGGSIAWLATSPELIRNIHDALMACLFISPFVFVAFFMQHVMAKERLSYYRVMRSVVRAQRLFGMFEHKFLSPGMGSAPFPLGLGPNPGSDGTQPFSSFWYRQGAIVVFLMIFLALAHFQIAPLPQWVAWGCAVADLGWLLYLYLRDDIKLYAAVLGEKGLAGFDDGWLPEGCRAPGYREALVRLPQRWAVR